MGNSPAPPDIRDLDGILAALLETVKGLTGGRRFLLAGTSAGAYLAGGLLRYVPNRVDGLLLRAPLVIPDDAARDVDPVQPVLIDPIITASILPSDREALGEILVQTQPYIQAQLKVLKAVAPADALANQSFLDSIRKDNERYRLTLEPGAADILFAGPSLMITGRHDESVGYRDAWRLSERLPRCTFVTLDRADHCLPIDQQELFEALVRDWLARVEEAGASVA